MRRRMQTCPLAKPGVAEGKGRQNRRGITRPAQATARKVGETGLDGRKALPLTGARGGPLSALLQFCASLNETLSGGCLSAAAGLAIRERDRYRMAGTTGPVRSAVA